MFPLIYPEFLKLVLTMAMAEEGPLDATGMVCRLVTAAPAADRVATVAGLSVDAAAPAVSVGELVPPAYRRDDRVQTYSPPFVLGDATPAVDYSIAAVGVAVYKTADTNIAAYLPLTETLFLSPENPTIPLVLVVILGPTGFEFKLEEIDGE